MPEDTTSLIKTIEEDVVRKREEERRRIEEETRAKVEAEFKAKLVEEETAKRVAEEKAALEAKMKQLEESQAQLQEQLKQQYTTKRGFVDNSPSPFNQPKGGIDVNKLDTAAVELESKRQFMLKSSGGRWDNY